MPETLQVVVAADGKHTKYLRRKRQYFFVFTLRFFFCFFLDSIVRIGVMWPVILFIHIGTQTSFTVAGVVVMRAMSIFSARI